MSDDFRSARHWAKELIENAMYPSARAIDATMGNGHDTKWLCELAGEEGHVYAFDIQQQAVESTRSRLQSASLENRATLIHAGHQLMGEYVKEPVDAIVFNLGWLPSGDKTVTTLTETTLQAVDAAVKLLAPGGIMTVCVYPGHDEGTREKHALIDWASALPHTVFDVMLKQYLNQPNQPPLMIAVRRRP